MDVAVFRKSPSGKLVRAGRGEAAHWSFVPSPLPPKLPFALDLIGVLSDADRALGELAGLARALPNPHLLVHPFIRREAVASSRIEGTESDLADLYAYEARQARGRSARPSAADADVREVLNYVHALEYGLARLETLPVSLRLMRELHERLMKDVRGGKATPGAFRRTPNWIGPPGSNLSSASYVPPPVPEMRECLDALEKYLHAEASHPPLVRLAFIHYQFEAIHPFLDGNGRIGRLLISLLAVHWGLLPLPLLYLSAFFERHREEYYSLLLSVSARGRWSEWVRFFLRGATVEARSALRKAQRLQDLQAEWRSRLTRRRASALLLRLADSLFNAPMLTVPDAQSTLNAAYTTAQRNVDRLVAEGILSPVGGETYGRFFVAEEILRVVDVEDGGGQI